MTFIDGSTKELRLMGSQHMFWYQDHDGHIYVQNTDNQWYFAKYETNDDGTGRVVSTGVLASSEAEVPIESNIKNLKIDQYTSIDLLTHLLQILKDLPQ